MLYNTEQLQQDPCFTYLQGNQLCITKSSEEQLTVDVKLNRFPANLVEISSHYYRPILSFLCFFLLFKSIGFTCLALYLGL